MARIEKRHIKPPHELERPTATRRRVLAHLGAMAGGTVAAGAAAPFIIKAAESLPSLPATPDEEASAAIPPAINGVTDAMLRIERNGHFEGAAGQFSAEQNAMGAHVIRVTTEEPKLYFESRFQESVRNGSDPADGIPFGIGEQSPIEYVRTHIYSVTAGLPEWMRRQMPSVAPALIAVESSFDINAYNNESGARSAAQYMPAQWERITARLRTQRRLGPRQTLDPKNLRDLTVFIGEYFVDCYEHLQRTLAETPLRGYQRDWELGRSLRNVRRLMFGVSPENDPAVNAEREEHFMQHFLFPLLVNAYNSGVPYALGAVRRFEGASLNEEEEGGVTTNAAELLDTDGRHAVYGRFLNTMKANPRNSFEAEQVNYVPLIWGMRERLDARRASETF